MPCCEALTNIDGIIAKSQALMVARGDLGVELGLNRVPFAQKLLIARAKQAGLFVPGLLFQGLRCSHFVTLKPLFERI